MTFNQAVELLSQGKKLKRSDWNYAPLAYLSTWSQFNTTHVYITGAYLNEPNATEKYNIVWDDIHSNNWELA